MSVLTVGCHKIILERVLCFFEGLGDPACFYVAVIFLLNGLMMALFFIYGTYLR